MTDGEALLRAIIENADEDTPRLAYADWLDENAQSDVYAAWRDENALAQRAEFIRIQCKLEQLLRVQTNRHELEVNARRSSGGRCQVFRFGAKLDLELESRAANLVSNHGSAWGHGLPDGIEYSSFRRGFIEEVSISGQGFLNWGEVLYSKFPVRHIMFLQTPMVLLPTLMACPLLSRLRSASFTPLGSFTALGHRGAELLANCPFLSGLQSLNLSHNEIGDAGLAALSHSRHLTRLSALELWNNDIGEDGVRILLSSPTFSRLAHLRIERTRFSMFSQRRLQEQFGDQVFDAPGML